MKAEIDAEQLVNFEVELRDGRLELRQTGPMPEPAVRYLERHLARLTKFKTVGFWHGARSISFFDPPLPHPAGKRGLVDRLERVFCRTRKPAAATLAITYNCQADCVHCSCAPNVRRQPPLSTEQWKRIIAETVDVGTTNVIFTGGEPLLRKDIFELIASVDEQRATTLMFTNGEMLSPETCAKLVDAGLYALFISLDSPEPAEHDRLRRRPGLFDTIMQNIEHAEQAGLMAGFSIYLTHAKHAAGELDAYMELGKKVGAKEIIQFDAVPTGRLFGQMDVLLREEDREEIRQKVLATYHQDMPGYPVLTSQALVNSPQSMGCFGAFNQFYMTAYGDMCPCDFTPICFGNAVEEGVAAVWERMTHHPLWCRRHKDCRMQTPEFRAQTVDLIPPDAPMPYPIETIDAMREKKAAGG
ncbi:MAG: radical SAM protein [Deltaproteobacteria bacterium]|nr:radical SAM protein [Deltaproteobacteria bacterium]